ncbi:PBSX family phage terminase large subunit [Allofournierella sp.]|uniref:PBSX family phage terminase large subunit n=1 Tax=Allofournierella sp. TaxID=1940256 RepID=UPI003AB1DFEC
MTISLSEVLSPGLYEAHRAVRRGGLDELVLAGGRGSTKSSFASVELVKLLLEHPECHAVVLRKVAYTLRTSVYEQVAWAIGALGLAGRFELTVSPMRAVYKPTGQRILFLGLDDPGKLKSIKVPFGYVGIAWFEELDQFSGPEEIRSVEQSLFRGGSFSFAFKSFNPPAMARSWANRYALEARAGKLVHHSDYRSVPAAWLGPRFLQDAEHLAATNPTAYRHEYLGEVVGSGNAVFENLRMEPISDEQLAGFERRLHGVDWGWYPDPWAYNGCSYDAARRVLYIWDELTRLRTSNQETARLLAERGVCQDPEADELLTADSAEEKSCSDYRAFGLPCRGAEKGPGSVRAGMKWLQSLSAIVIDPERCPDTAREFSEYEYELDKKTNEVLPGYPDINNHHIDAVRYATNRIWKRRGA